MKWGEVKPRAWSIISWRDKLYIILEFEHQGNDTFVHLARWYWHVNDIEVRSRIDDLKPHAIVPIAHLQNCEVVFNW